jgi:hypothetical protein
MCISLHGNPAFGAGDNAFSRIRGAALTARVRILPVPTGEKPIKDG